MGRKKTKSEIKEKEEVYEGHIIIFCDTKKLIYEAYEEAVKILENGDGDIEVITGNLADALSRIETFCVQSSNVKGYSQYYL